MNILIPVGGRPAWEELRYCLRSIAKYIPTASVTIYSDRDVDWIQNVDFHKMDRFYPKESNYKMFENYWDTINKIYTYSNIHYGMDEFMYMYDDMVLLQEPNRDTFNAIALQPLTITDFKNSKDRHARTVRKAMNLLLPIKSSLYNYESHCPRMFTPRRVTGLFNVFNIMEQEVPPAFSTLYYNYIYDQPSTILTDRNDIRASFCFEEDDSGCYIACKEYEIIEACKDKYVLHYNDVGLNFAPNGVQILKEHIMKLFPNPCKYERN